MENIFHPERCLVHGALRGQCWQCKLDPVDVNTTSLHTVYLGRYEKEQCPPVKEGRWTVNVFRDVTSAELTSYVPLNSLVRVHVYTDAETNDVVDFQNQHSIVRIRPKQRLSLKLQNSHRVILKARMPDRPGMFEVRSLAADEWMMYWALRCATTPITKLPFDVIGIVKAYLLQRRPKDGQSHVLCAAVPGKTPLFTVTTAVFSPQPPEKKTPVSLRVNLPRGTSQSTTVSSGEPEYSMECTGQTVVHGDIAHETFNALLEHDYTKDDLKLRLGTTGSLTYTVAGKSCTVCTGMHRPVMSLLGLKLLPHLQELHLEVTAAPDCNQLTTEWGANVLQLALPPGNTHRLTHLKIVSDLVWTGGGSPCPGSRGTLQQFHFSTGVASDARPLLEAVMRDEVLPNVPDVSLQFHKPDGWDENKEELANLATKYTTDTSQGVCLHLRNPLCD
eukprot:TRINITY_DN58308_c0_g1_i1.p1 TRINITY_DN58308_c0_g1~~TRINITY_DN58308_c0_g1_i1.p1  ORF type:complete len:453 (-),score=18.93 TRINITY_DN58308_c0_g1_i1:12-1349(-)